MAEDSSHKTPAGAAGAILRPALRLGHCPVAVTDLIAAQAGRAPQRIAVTWRHGQPWTYSMLMEKADAIARALLERGIVHGELVGVCMPRRPEMVAAVLGIMRAGAAYVPLESTAPGQRLEYVANHTGFRHLLAWQEAQVPAVLASRARLLVLDGFNPGSTSKPALPALGGNDLAYILYTSGSTGQPKGVRTLHRNLVNDLLSLKQEPGIGPEDVFGAFTTLTFDPSVHELFLPLLVGARIVVATETEQTDPAAASALLREHPMTLLESSPIMLRLMLVNGRLPELHGTKLWVGGEALPRDLAEAVLPHCDELWNMYGPTETTVESTIHRVTHGTGPVPIGTPIANTTIYLLDDAGALITDGRMGEIWIGGAGVADGYHDDPGRTAEAFVLDPFAADGSRMYRTGDLGTIRDGLLYFHGRADDQLNLHGIRVEPGEIEAAALQAAGVHQAVVVVRGDVDQYLTLYVVADHDPDLETRLREVLRTRLPGEIWPRYIETLDALPRTANGKVDRRALAARPATTAARTPAASTAGANPRAAWSPLVALQPHGRLAPLFLIHAIDGRVLDYVPLARGLGAGQPVYGIQAIGLDGLAAPMDSIPAMAACYVTEIQRVQPRGPYFLGGESMGGLVAYEMARQLHARGESVALLAMLAVDLPGSAAPSPLGRIRRAIDALRVRRARAARRALPPGLRHREIERAHDRAMLAYRIQPCACRGVLFRATTPPGTGAAAGPGWVDFMQGGIEVFELSGRHRPFARHPELLRKLHGILEDAQASVATGGFRPDPGRPRACA
ncbi:MAG TPA: amino acid adenylation domain-containing protein [Rhodanobacteraceae bacterium]|nr:amino acid adenylation domain-containing protein [Rhodanobacteraceae bacterium]